MKKFVSICFCLMLCLTSLLMISGCEAKPKSVSEEQATVVLETAMINLETASAIKMECDNFMFMGSFVSILSEDIQYTNFLGAQSWIKQEGNYLYNYSKVTIQEDGQAPETTYTKSLVIEEDEDSGDGDILSMLFEEFEDSEFSKASLLEEEYSISFKVVEEGVTTTMTFVIENNMLEEIVVSAQGVSMAIEFEFGADAIEDIPQLPTNVDWIEYEPYIEVYGMPTEFVVGDTLDLSDVVIEYYEDFESYYDDYDITMSMISGFDTTTATEVGQTRTMTITFYGLTYNVEYTVSEANVE